MKNQRRINLENLSPKIVNIMFIVFININESRFSINIFYVGCFDGYIKTRNERYYSTQFGMSLWATFNDFHCYKTNCIICAG